MGSPCELFRSQVMLCSCLMFQGVLCSQVLPTWPDLTRIAIENSWIAFRQFMFRVANTPACNRSLSGSLKTGVSEGGSHGVSRVPSGADTPEPSWDTPSDTPPVFGDTLRDTPGTLRASCRRPWGSHVQGITLVVISSWFTSKNLAAILAK